MSESAPRLLGPVAALLGRPATAVVAIFLGSLLVLVAFVSVVVTVMSMGGGLVIGYVAAAAALLFILGSWIITRTIQWLRT
jgi:hypothetical protein